MEKLTVKHDRTTKGNLLILMLIWLTNFWFQIYRWFENK